MIAFIADVTQSVGAPWMGIVIPAIIFIVSFMVAFLLYRHFSKKIQ